MLVKAKKLGRCERIKLVMQQTSLAIKEDRMNWLVFYASFVNKMLRE